MLRDFQRFSAILCTAPRSPAILNAIVSVSNHSIVALREVRTSGFHLVIHLAAAAASTHGRRANECRLRLDVQVSTILTRSHTCWVCHALEYLEMAMRDYLAILRDITRCYAISRDLTRRYAQRAP